VTNPDFHLGAGAIRREAARMRREPVGLQRPLLVLAGWRAPSGSVRLLGRQLAALTGGDRSEVLPIAYPLASSIGASQRVLERAIDRAWGRPPGEVDIVAISMGGLLARRAALPRDRGGAGLFRIARLFTLGTPHRGARLAGVLRPDACCRDMRPGSPFLRGLEGAAGPESGIGELVCYARLRDTMVGARNCAPPGREPIWKPGPIILSHVLIALDPLIRLDIARRLRGEEPIARGESRPPRQ
jgi:pimeloyl-ACP methyl ester carboxylesterase